MFHRYLLIILIDYLVIYKSENLFLCLLSIPDGLFVYPSFIFIFHLTEMFNLSTNFLCLFLSVITYVSFFFFFYYLYCFIFHSVCNVLSFFHPFCNVSFVFLFYFVFRILCFTKYGENVCNTEEQ